MKVSRNGILKQSSLVAGKFSAGFKASEDTEIHGCHVEFKEWLVIPQFQLYINLQ